MTKKQKKMVARLVGSAVFFIVAMMLEKKTFWAWIPFVLSYLAAGYDIPLRACRNLKNGQVFDENFLMTIATLGALVLWKKPWRSCCFTRLVSCSMIMRSTNPENPSPI